MINPVLRFTVIAGAIMIAACAHDAPTKPSDNTTAGRAPLTPSMQLSAAPRITQDYILDFTGNSLPADLAAQVQTAGGVLTTSIGQIGVAVATTDDPGFEERAEKIPGVFSVMPDMEVQWLDPRETVVGEEVSIDEAAPPPEAFATVGAAETFRLVQWAPDAISAPAAWDAGATGAGVRVAVLDGGIHSSHIDIAPNLDVARSRSFVLNTLTPDPTDFVPFNVDFRRRTTPPFTCDLPDTFWHGTHVAGIIGAPAQNLGTVGVAPAATLIGVKVLNCGSGSFSSIINAIVYAALPISEGGAGADVINMSLGAEFTRQPRDTAGRPLRNPLTGKVISANGNALLARAIGKATTFAYQNGVTVVAAMGNSARDLDHTADVIALPAMSPHVIAVSATGPVGWAATGATNFDEPASYTNFGQSAVDFAAPGGNDEYRPLNQLCIKPRIGGGPPVQQLCFGFDFVFAPVRGTTNGSYNWAEGTSMASPMVAGVAALIIGKFGRIGPAAVEQRLRQTADDLGKPGNDDFYGAGRVNALRAIQ